MAGAHEEEYVVFAVLLDGLAVELRPKHGPFIVQQLWIAVVQPTVNGQVSTIVRHPAGDAEIQHVLLDEHVLDVAHGFGIREVIAQNVPVVAHSEFEEILRLIAALV